MSSATESTDADANQRSNARGRETEYGREFVFGLGVVAGMTVFAVGVATLVLAMSVGFRRGQTLLSPGAGTALLAGGGLLVVVGFLVRFYRHRISLASESRLRTGGLVLALLGVAAVLFATAAGNTTSAPFLVSPGEKVLLFGVAYGLIAVGLVVVRAAATFVGW